MSADGSTDVDLGRVSEMIEALVAASKRGTIILDPRSADLRELMERFDDLPDYAHRYAIAAAVKRERRRRFADRAHARWKQHHHVDEPE